MERRQPPILKTAANDDGENGDTDKWPQQREGGTRHFAKLERPRNAAAAQVSKVQFSLLSGFHLPPLLFPSTKRVIDISILA